MLTPKPITKRIFQKEEEMEILKVELKRLEKETHEKNLEFINFQERFQRHERDFWTMVQDILQELKGEKVVNKKDI